MRILLELYEYIVEYGESTKLALNKLQEVVAQKCAYDLSVVY